MIEAACVMGCIAGGGNENQKRAPRNTPAASALISRSGRYVDVLSTVVGTGKTIGSDLAGADDVYCPFSDGEMRGYGLGATVEAVKAVRAAFLSTRIFSRSSPPLWPEDEIN
jgi:hypothetical protein